MITSTACRRQQHVPPFAKVGEGMSLAENRIQEGRWLEAFDLFEAMIARFPEQAIVVLNAAYDAFARLPDRSRYGLYQARLFDFGICPGDRVLDIGSGHNPFPLATDLADISLSDHSIGRAGVPFRYVDGKAVHEVNIEATGFPDKAFDFVYCSHVLEHANDPAAACRELMRIGRRGYIETPTRGKDAFLGGARISNHRWSVEEQGGTLVFSEYGSDELDGIGSDLLLNMHCDPRTEREKAFAALVWLKPRAVNTMVTWEADFPFRVQRQRPVGRAPSPPPRPLRLLQVHTFYDEYLRHFYRGRPQLAMATSDAQTDALLADGFSAVHLIAPYMEPYGYDGRFVVANGASLCRSWCAENGLDVPPDDRLATDALRAQIEAFQPDVLYLTDPITFDSRFLRTLRHRPRLIIGWRAANVPVGTDWSEIDILLSSLSGVREAALGLGARSVASFSPGFPEWIAGMVGDVTPDSDVVFTGQATTTQHAQRNAFLASLAAYGEAERFDCAFYLSGDTESLPPPLRSASRPPVFGLDMYRALRNGRIVFDGRGSIALTGGRDGVAVDLARRETANMRLFEATGVGAFVLSERFDNLEDFFEPGREIEVYSDVHELVDKTRFYLNHPEERQRIADRGLRRCRSQHSMTRVAARLDGIIRQALE